VVSPFIKVIDAHMTRRILMFTAALVLSTSSLAGATTHPIAIKGVAHLTAAPRGGLSVVLATLSNNSNKPIAIYRITSVVAPPAMLHYDVNMCDKGRQMNTLPMVIIAPHQSLRLSTRGVGAMLFPLNRALRQKSQISLQVTYRWKGMAGTFVTSAIVTKKVKGLVSAPPKNSVN
jgi:copper(I)-binding protein